MNNSVMFASNSDEWATPQAFYDEINREFGFNLDPCATDANHKCSEYYTKEQNGLEKSWGGVAYFVTRRTVSRLPGSANATRKGTKTTPSLFASFQRGPIPDIFTNIYTTAPRSALYAGA